MGSIPEAKIILYTNHRCPWAHRAHIALAELKIPFEEVIIDLDRPRDPWYLEVNPRGLVPSLSYNGEIITESAVVSQFLADAYPSRLLPQSEAPGAALRRARIAFFVDSFFTKVQSHFFKFGGAKTDEEIDAVGQAAGAAIAKELEPLLKDARPFFGGSDHITLAEVLTGSFVVRLVSNAKAGTYPSSLAKSLAEKTPHFWKWAETVASHPSVTNIYDEKRIVEQTKARLAKARGQA